MTARKAKPGENPPTNPPPEPKPVPPPAAQPAINKAEIEALVAEAINNMHLPQLIANAAVDVADQRVKEIKTMLAPMVNEFNARKAEQAKVQEQPPQPGQQPAPAPTAGQQGPPPDDPAIATVPTNPPAQGGGFLGQLLAAIPSIAPLLKGGGSGSPMAAVAEMFKGMSDMQQAVYAFVDAPKRAAIYEVAETVKLALNAGADPKGTLDIIQARNTPPSQTNAGANSQTANQ